MLYVVRIFQPLVSHTQMCNVYVSLHDCHLDIAKLVERFEHLAQITLFGPNMQE